MPRKPLHRLFSVRLTPGLRGGVAAFALIVCLPSAPVEAQQGDARIVAAREALRTGDRVRLEALAAAPEPGHILDHYVQYWLLVNRLARPDPVPTLEIAGFVDRHRENVTGERLFDYWLRRLARDENWSAFRRVFAEHPNPNQEIRCLAWYGRFVDGERGALDEVAHEWRDLLNAHEACEPVLRAAATLDAVTEDEVWWRIRRQVDSRSPDNARATIAWLPSSQRPVTRDLDQALGSPAAYLDRMPVNFAVTRSGRELAIAALTRLARQDAMAAYARFVRINDRLGHDERSYVFTVLAHHGALSRLPQAAEWYRAAGDVPMTQAQREWGVRAALRAENWRQVENAIALLDADSRNSPEWVYWLARAHEAQGRADPARTLYATIAGRSDFYGLLAAETLGERFAPPPPDEPVSPEDRARVLANDGIARALAFYRLEMTTEAVREWIRTLRGRDRAFLLAAAHIALDHGLFDRAINTAELADPNANFSIRFIMPFRDLVEPHVRERNLDLAWVYGLMRQESRFIVPARSHVGAQGLMQVMPDTGRWVAGQIGMRDFHPRMLNDPQTNVHLGTSYMRLIMGGLDNHPVLASAGYNAGPGRARRWRDDRPIEAAIYIETIPFDETRDYVKKVLANAVVYAALIEQRPQSLKRWLGTISPAPGG